MGIHLATEHALELELSHPGFELPGVAFDVARGGFVVFTFRHFQQLRRIADRAAGAIELAQIADEARTLAAQLLGAFGRIPDGGILQLAADFF
jgi:GAF domain-containing protein